MGLNATRALCSRPAGNPPPEEESADAYRMDEVESENQKATANTAAD
ncbi:MAG: hypothetical protein ACOVRB_07490 [Akkermansiaceae bacterium]